MTLKYKPRTYNVREDLAKAIAMIAARSDVNISDMVNTAFESYLKSQLSPKERRVFGIVNGEKKEQTDE